MPDSQYLFVLAVIRPFFRRACLRVPLRVVVAVRHPDFYLLIYHSIAIRYGVASTLHVQTEMGAK